MAITLLILVVALIILGLGVRPLSNIKIDGIFRSRADFSNLWIKKYPTKEKEIEKFLIIFCSNFGLSPSLCKNFKPNDEINIIYDYLYPKATKWWQFEGGDNLEHHDLFTELESETGKSPSLVEIEKLKNLSECFEYFFIK